MNNHLKRFIGQYITVKYSFFADGEHHVEYIQGVLKNIDDKIIIDQYLTYYNLVAGDKNLPVVTRVHNLSDIEIISKGKL